MKKYIVFGLIALMLSFSLVVAIPTKDKQEFNLPENAKKISDNVYFLGEKDVNGQKAEGYAIITYKDSNVKENNARKPSSGSLCYTYLASGAKWKTVEPYLVDASNNAGLSTTFVKSNLVADIDKWEVAASADIFGNENLSGIVNRTTIGNLNGNNDVIFADIGSEGAIAVTLVWGYFSGPSKFRELVEWDQVYDDADFNWSSTGEVGKMDFENIAQHELGHSVGMGHPSDSCTEETMYRFASLGETKKRTLNAGDITGVNALYN